MPWAWSQISLVRLTGENFGRDVEAWRRWWDARGGKPPIPSQRVVWTQRPQWGDPQWQIERDREWIEREKARSPAGENGGAPKVVSTVPENGAAAVDPGLAEIRVTFSKSMKDKSWSFCKSTEGEFPTMSGEPRYLADQRTCVLPVRLEPDRTYAVSFNSAKFGSFQDTDGRSAITYLLRFKTRAAATAPAGPPPPATGAAGLSRKVALRPPYPLGPAGTSRGKLTVQDAVKEIATQAGLGFDAELSRRNTDPLCRRLIQPAIVDQPLEEAIRQIVEPLGLGYQVANGNLVLVRAEKPVWSPARASAR